MMNNHPQEDLKNLHQEKVKEEEKRILLLTQAEKSLTIIDPAKKSLTLEIIRLIQNLKKLKPHLDEAHQEVKIQAHMIRMKALLHLG
jgi:hypothetical protein